MCYVNKIRYQTIVTNEINKKERKKERIKRREKELGVLGPLPLELRPINGR